MKEKLNELLEKAESEIVKYNNEIIEINYKMLFLKEHGFNKELEWLKYKKDSMIEIFRGYKSTVKNLREMLNAWYKPSF